jgi:hypothetical protein
MKFFLTFIWLAALTLQANIFADFTEVDNFLNPGSSRVSGFTPFTSTQRVEQIANPHLRHAHQRLARSEARADAQWQEFERMANIAKSPDIRARFVPNGIITF